MRILTWISKFWILRKTSAFWWKTTIMVKKYFEFQLLDLIIIKSEWKRQKSERNRNNYIHVNSNSCLARVSVAPWSWLPPIRTSLVLVFTCKDLHVPHIQNSSACLQAWVLLPSQQPLQATAARIPTSPCWEMALFIMATGRKLQAKQCLFIS